MGLIIYLLANAIAYAGFAVWSWLYPERTAAFLGQAFLSSSGRCEFTTVYGGLEAGLAAFFAWSAFQPGLRYGALTMATCMYVGIAIARSAGLLQDRPVSSHILMVAALEGAFTLWSIVLMVSSRPGH
jgi:hypothetical protein